MIFLPLCKLTSHALWDSIPQRNLQEKTCFIADSHMYHCPGPSCLKFTQASEPWKVVKWYQFSQRAEELLLSKPDISSRQIKSNIPLYNKINVHLGKYLRQVWAHEKEVVFEGVNKYSSMQTYWFLFLTIGEQWAHLLPLLQVHAWTVRSAGAQHSTWEKSIFSPCISLLLLKITFSCHFIAQFTQYHTSAALHSSNTLNNFTWYINFLTSLFSPPIQVQVPVKIPEDLLQQGPWIWYSNFVSYFYMSISQENLFCLILIQICICLWRGSFYSGDFIFMSQAVEKASTRELLMQ